MTKILVFAFWACAFGGVFDDLAADLSDDSASSDLADMTEPTSLLANPNQCKTVVSGIQNSAYVACPSGYTMVGGGVNNHHRLFDRLSVYEDSRPHGNGWLCDMGLGAGRMQCFARCCKLPSGTHCETRTAKKVGHGHLSVGCSAGYTSVGGGMVNHHRLFDHNKITFEATHPWNNNWNCDMGAGWGHYTCYNRCCRFPGNQVALSGRVSCRVVSATKHGVGTAYAKCPTGTVMTGGGAVNHHRHWGGKSAFEAMIPHGNGFLCDMGHGSGHFTCQAKCCG